MSPNDSKGGGAEQRGDAAPRQGGERWVRGGEAGRGGASGSGPAKPQPRHGLSPGRVHAGPLSVAWTGGDSRNTSVTIFKAPRGCSGLTVPGTTQIFRCHPKSPTLLLVPSSWRSPFPCFLPQSGCQPAAKPGGICCAPSPLPTHGCGDTLGSGMVAGGQPQAPGCWCRASSSLQVPRGSRCRLMALQGPVRCETSRVAAQWFLLWSCFC